MISASSLHRLEHCTGSEHLPRHNETGEYTDHGNAVDAFVTLAVRKGRDAALAAAPLEMRAELSALDVSAIPAGVEMQVALGWDPVMDGARRYDLDGHRAYPEDGLLHGTADMMGVIVEDGARRVFVADLKTGSYADGRDPADDLQLGFYALAGARLVGASAAEVMFLRAGWDGKLRPDRAELDAFALEEVAERVRRIVERAAKPDPILHVGEWCRYCPSLRYCPAQTAIVRRVATLDMERVAEHVVALSDAEAGEFYEQVVLVEKMAEAAKKALQARAAQTPDGLPLPGGKVLKAIDWTVWKKSDAAKAALEQLTEDLKASGEIAPVPSVQIRAVGGKRKKAA